MWNHYRLTTFTGNGCPESPFIKIMKYLTMIFSYLQYLATVWLHGVLSELAVFSLQCVLILLLEVTQI